MHRLPLAPLVTVLALLSWSGLAPAQQGPMPQGEHLLGELACTACHEAPDSVLERLQPKAGPRLEEVGRRMTPESIRRYLLHPHAERPGTSMPDMLAGLEAADRERTVDALTHWLVSRGGPLQPEPVRVSPGRIENGRQLYHSVGCIACHAPQEPVRDLELGFWEFEGEATAEDFAHPGGVAAPEGTLAPQNVPLGNLGRRTTPAALADFLQDPLAVRPSGRMPSLGLARAEAEDIAFYLLRDQALDAGGGLETAPGLTWARHEGNFRDVRPEGSTFAGEPAERGVALDLEELPDYPSDHFAFRFEGFIDIEETGNHGFSTNSDDGSRLFIGGTEVVDNDGNHAPRERKGEIWLEAGRHSFLATWYEGAGGETFEVKWQPPGAEWGPIPGELFSHSAVEFDLRVREFEVDPVLAREGRLAFESMGCVACHEDSASLPPTAGLLDLGGASCAAAHYDLDAEEERALSRTLADVASLAEPLEPAVAASHALERFRCYTCHQRDGLGGVHPERSPYFKAKIELDLGNEGRLPPHLEQVGAKLRAPWLKAVLEGPDARVRPYLSARMPQFGAENLALLADALLAADAHPGMDEEPPFSEEAVEHGRALAGTSGLGCIQCHNFGKYESLGIPAVDLTKMHERIRPGWFHSLLMDPDSVGMNSRMPIFWNAEGKSPVEDVLDGDPAAQARALRTYLSLGEAMPLPEGLATDDAHYELVPLDRPVQAAVFLEGVGPRVLLVGTPDYLHFAYDLESSTLTHAWRGRYFNAKGTWHGRAGALERIPETGSIALPLDSPLAVLDEAAASWPTTRGREAGIRPLGRRINADGLPVFRYAWQDIEVEETVRPRDGALVRSLRLESPSSPPEGASFLLLRGDGLESTGDGGYELANGTTVSVAGLGTNSCSVRRTARGDELVFALDFPAGPVSGSWSCDVEVSYQWR